jgi:anti-anti-sigma regulatory factor
MVTPIPPPAPSLAQSTGAAAPASVVQLRLTPEQTVELHRHIPSFAARVREVTRSSRPAEVVIDLTGVGPGPFYAELACLCEVLRRLVGQHTQITLRNVNPAVAISLQAGYLPQEVRIIPTRRRRSHLGPSSPRDGPGV